MLTKIITAALGLIVALMVLRFLSGRAHRAYIRKQSLARQRREAEAAREPAPKTRPETRPDRKPHMVTTLEVDPETGVYRPKG